MCIIAAFGDDSPFEEPSTEYIATRRRWAKRLCENSGATGHVVIRVIGEVTPDLAASISETLLFEAPAAATLSIEINSTGGCAISSAFIYGLVRRHPAERKEAYLYGDCSSGALTIALAADRRTAHPSTKILLHPSRIVLSADCGGWTAENLSKQSEILRAVDDEIAGMVAARTGARLSAIRLEARTEEFARLEWCLQNRIIHAIAEHHP